MVESCSHNFVGQKKLERLLCGLLLRHICLTSLYREPALAVVTLRVPDVPVVTWNLRGLAHGPGRAGQWPLGEAGHVEVKPGPVHADLALGAPASVLGVHLGCVVQCSLYLLWNPQG